MKKFILSILAASFAFSSCTNFFEATPDNILENDDHYSSPANVYAAFAGLLTCVQNVAAINIIINDLRSDVMTPTSKAPDDYWELFNFQATTGNELADPTPFYNVVLNANDFLRKIVAYNEENPGFLETAQYEQLIAGAVNVRAWSYLQIGKIYGEAAYFDYSIPNQYVDLSTIPVLSFDELINELLYFIDTGVDGVSGWSAVQLDELFDITGAYWPLLAIAPDAMKLELYLWKQDYSNAATTGIRMITNNSVLSDSYTSAYTMASTYYSGSNWKTLFSNTPVATFAFEAFSFVMFDNTMGQENDLHYLCSNTPPNVYYMKPTDALLDRFERSTYYEYGGSAENFESTSSRDEMRNTPFDERSENVTYGEELGETVMMKYHCNDRDYYDRDASIFLYRASEIHLMIAEALVKLDNLDAADIMLNDGFKTMVSGGSLLYPFDAPIFSYSKLNSGLGVRGRVSAPVVRTDSIDGADFYYGIDLTDDAAYNARRAYVLDSLIANETALELAGEGKRWFTLLRMARNNNDPDFLIDQIIEKYPEETRSRYEVLLQNQDTWFINYDLGVSYTDSYNTSN